MLAKIISAAVVGLEGVPITVEVDIASQGLPSFTIVGLPDKAVEESKERVRAAIKNSGAEFPARRITVNLAPADLPKAGPVYDLPIAIGILVASEQIPSIPTNCIFLGELSLDGSLRHANGILSLALLAQSLKLSQVYVPAPDASEAAVISQIKIYPVVTLVSLFHHFTNIAPIEPAYPADSPNTHESSRDYDIDFADIQGQEHVKRALEIAHVYSEVYSQN